jgi:hypothetical protein
MANEFYNGRALRCTASYNSASDSWVPSISITWREADDSHFHTFDGPPKFFITAADAIAYGLMLGRLWVDKKLPRLANDLSAIDKIRKKSEQKDNHKS